MGYHLIQMRKCIIKYFLVYRYVLMCNSEILDLPSGENVDRGLVGRDGGQACFVVVTNVSGNIPPPFLRYR